MQAKIDPGLTLMYKGFFPLLAAFRKELRLWTLHSQIRIPSVMVHLPYVTHSAFDSIGNNLISINKRRPFCDGFVGNRLILQTGKAISLRRYCIFQHRVFAHTETYAFTFIPMTFRLTYFRIRIHSRRLF